MKLLALALLLAFPSRASPAEDGLRRLERDPSPEAARRLSQLYRRTKDRDQRFWLIQSLGFRLRSHADPEAFEVLLGAAVGGDPGLRGSALRELAYFGALPGEALEEGRLARLDSAVRSAALDKAAAVRTGGEHLRRALELWRGAEDRPLPEPADGDEPPEGPPRWRWLWALALPALAAVWAVLGLPVLDRDSEPGRRAREAWDHLRAEPTLLALAFPLWAALSAILAGYGFDVLARGLGQPLYPASGSPFAAWLAAGACVFLPGALVAVRLAGGGSAWAALGALPRVAALGSAAWVAAHLELLYRLLWRSPYPSVRRPQVPGGGIPSGYPSVRRPQVPGGGIPSAYPSVRRRGALAWMLEAGALRCAYLACAVLAREGHGVLPALRRARELAEGAGLPALGMAAFDARFALLGAAPAMGSLSLVAARWLPVSWRAAAPLVTLGCVFWAWTVLAGTLFAVLQALEGASAARAYRAAASRPEHPGEE